jgi:enamine deaminase RidA (YjgF/YER057c/UK114 family)
MIRKSVPSNRIWSKAAYSRALRIDERIEVSGTTAADSAGAVMHPGDMFAQATVVLERIRAAVEELGGSVDDIVRTRVFTTDIKRWEEIGRAHHAMFGNMEMPPVSAFYGVKELLHPDILIEIEASAIVQG